MSTEKRERKNAVVGVRKEKKGTNVVPPGQVDKGDGKKESGHTTYKKAVLKARPGEKDDTPVIAKDNKKAGSDGVNASLLEVGFGAVSRLFIGAKYTPKHQVMVDENGDVSGVISYSISNEIKKMVKEKKQRLLRMIDNDGKLLETHEMRPFDETDTNFQSGYVFFDHKKPLVFFNNIMQAFKDKVIDIDMESLVAILGGAYLLEEDDLHKGNFGYYITQDTPTSRKKYTFFKIDHDLMFKDSIMSYQKSWRPTKLHLAQHAFNITAADLNRFPDLQDSHNYYWPTKSRFVGQYAVAVSGGGSKTFWNPAERQAYVDLNKEDAFNQQKWKFFLKCSLMPRELVQDALTHHLDPEVDAAHISLIVTALDARLAKFKRALLKSEAFRDYVKGISEETLQSIKNDILESEQDIDISDAELLKNKQVMSEKIDALVDAIKLAANGKSSLYREIALDAYRFKGKQKWDPKAFELAKTNFKTETNPEKKFVNALVILDLLKRSKAPKDPTLLKNLQEYKEKYLDSKNINGFESFKTAMLKIRSANLSLKQHKTETFELLKNLTLAQMPAKDLDKIRSLLLQTEPKDPAFKFINQLRSTLWFVRVFRGLYGATSACNAMLTLLDARVAERKTADKMDVTIHSLSSSQSALFRKPTPTSKEDKKLDLTETSKKDGKPDIDTSGASGIPPGFLQ